MPGYIDGTTYTADGQTASITYDNDVDTAFTHSPDRLWLTRIRTVAPAMTEPVLIDNAYTRDDAGRIASINGKGSAETTVDDWVYTYNHLALRQAQEAAPRRQSRRQHARR